MAKKQQYTTGTVEHNIYIADYRFEYCPGSLDTPQLRSTYLTAIYRADELGSIKVKERDIPDEDLEWLTEKAEREGIELLINP